MGRYYKTASPQNTDYMFRLPEQMMLGAVQQASEDVSQKQAALYELYGKLQLQALDPDDEAAKRILDTYEQSINDLTADLQRDPNSFRKKGGAIISLAKDMQKNFSTGEASVIQGNYNKYAKFQEDYEKQEREGKIKNTNTLAALHKANLERYAEGKGANYNPTTGRYNTINLEELVPYVDISEFMNKTAKDVEYEKNAYADADLTTQNGVEGKFIKTISGKTEFRTEEMIANAMRDAFIGNEEALRYVEQGSRLGTMRGYFDGKGQFIEPYSVTVDKKTKKRQLEFNEKSALAPMISSANAKYARSNITDAKESLSYIREGNGSGTTKRSGTPVLDISGDVVVPVSIYNPNALDEQKKPISGTKQLDAKADELGSIEKNNQILLDGLKGIQATITNRYVNDGDESNDEVGKKIVTEIGKINYKDPASIDNVRNILKDNNLTDSDIDVALRQIRNNLREADALRAQNAIVTNLAAKTNQNVDDVFKNNMTQVSPYTLTRGDYYSDRDGSHSKKFEAVIEEATRIFTDFANLPPEFVVVDFKPNGNIKTGIEDKDKFLQSNFIADKKGNVKVALTEEERQQATSNYGKNVVASDFKNQKTDTPDGKDALSENGVYQMIGELPTPNGTYTNPFIMKIKNVYGETISIALPDDIVKGKNYSEIQDVYAYKLHYSKMTNMYDAMTKPFIDDAKEADVDLSLSDAYKFEMLPGVTFIPDIENGTRPTLDFSGEGKKYAAKVGSLDAEVNYKSAYNLNY